VAIGSLIAILVEKNNRLTDEEKLGKKEEEMFHTPMMCSKMNSTSYPSAGFLQRNTRAT